MKNDNKIINFEPLPKELVGRASMDDAKTVDIDHLPEILKASDMLNRFRYQNSKREINIENNEVKASTLNKSNLGFKPGDIEKYIPLSEESIARELIAEELKQRKQKKEGQNQQGQGQQGKGKPQKGQNLKIK